MLSERGGGSLDLYCSIAVSDYNMLFDLSDSGRIFLSMKSDCYKVSHIAE